MLREFELLKIQDSEAVKNTYYRSPRVTPNIEKKSNCVIIKTLENQVEIRKLEEIILYIIADFKFSPFWLVQQWFEVAKRKDCFKQVSNWVQTGIVWIETTSIGVFLRPSKLLLDLFKIEFQDFVQIQLGTMNHTCSEEQLIFDMMFGNENSEMWQIVEQDEKLPCYHPLGIEVENDRGTIAIRERNFKIDRYKEKEIIEREKDLIKDISSGDRFTMEFNDFSLFPIVNFNEKKELVTQTPDVIVPIPRIDTLPRSYAIELELSPKMLFKYINIMKNYKNNNRFGKLFYLCSSVRISESIRKAYKEVGGLGTCELFIIPFTSPSMKLLNFDYEDYKQQGTLLKLSISNTKK